MIVKELSTKTNHFVVHGEALNLKNFEFEKTSYEAFEFDQLPFDDYFFSYSFDNGLHVSMKCKSSEYEEGQPLFSVLESGSIQTVQLTVCGRPGHPSALADFAATCGKKVERGYIPHVDFNLACQAYTFFGNLTSEELEQYGMLEYEKNWAYYQKNNEVTADIVFYHYVESQQDVEYGDRANYPEIKVILSHMPPGEAMELFLKLMIEGKTLPEHPWEKLEYLIEDMKKSCVITDAWSKENKKWKHLVETKKGYFELGCRATGQYNYLTKTQNQEYYMKNMSDKQERTFTSVEELGAYLRGAFI